MQFLHCLLLCVCSKVVWSKARRKGKMKDRVKSAELWGLRSSALCSHVNLFQAHPATFSTTVLHPSQMFWNPSKAWTNCCLKIKLWCFRCVCDSNCVGDIVMLGVPREPYFPEICPLFHITHSSPYKILLSSYSSSSTKFIKTALNRDTKTLSFALGQFHWIGLFW